MASDALSYIFQGLAQGVPQGINVGFLARELQVKKQAQELEKVKMAAEMEKQKAAQSLDAFGKITDLYNKAPQSQRQTLWEQLVVPKTNELFGTSLDPKVFPKGADQYLKEANDVIGKMRKKEIGEEEGLYFLAGIRTSLEKEYSDQLGSVIGDLPAAQRMKNQAAKAITPDKALERMTALQKAMNESGKLTELQAALSISNPELAEQFGKIPPEDQAALRARALSEIENLNQYLSEDQRVTAVTRQEFKAIKERYEKALGRKVPDAEILKKVILVD